MYGLAGDESRSNSKSSKVTETGHWAPALTQYHEGELTCSGCTWNDRSCLCFSDFIDLSNLTHQHFHLDITDKLFILAPVAKCKDLAGRNSLSSEGGYLLKQRSIIVTVTLTNTLLTSTNCIMLYCFAH